MLLFLTQNANFLINIFQMSIKYFSHQDNQMFPDFNSIMCWWSLLIYADDGRDFSFSSMNGQFENEVTSLRDAGKIIIKLKIDMINCQRILILVEVCILSAIATILCDIQFNTYQNSETVIDSLRYKLLSILVFLPIVEFQVMKIRKKNIINISMIRNYF